MKRPSFGASGIGRYARLKRKIGAEAFRMRTHTEDASILSCQAAGLPRKTLLRRTVPQRVHNRRLQTGRADNELLQTEARLFFRPTHPHHCAAAEA